MCGISALIGTKNEQFSRIVGEMNDLISHRGPDGDGVYSRGNVALGHRRLSIVDLSSAGAQPMVYEDRYVIVYNGEVYNHFELREELKTAGYTFTSGSDTEVILAAYAHWGVDCLQRFNGMWAFAIYDQENEKLFLARDRFGVKPLYYWLAPTGTIAIASEIKQFTKLPGWSAKLNGPRAFEFLKWGVLDHTRETMFQDVFQLRGGESLFLSTATEDLSLLSLAAFQSKVTAWYNFESRKTNKSFSESVQEIKSLLEDSVRLRLRADVTVGSCLSGGLDSSSIVCTMSELLKESSAKNAQKTFSACADIKKYDEREYIEQVVARTKVDPHYTFPKYDKLFNILDKITWHQDEPFGSTSIFAQWSVFELAKEQRVKVMLDGQGADEQLVGYHSFFGTYWAQLFRTFQWQKLTMELIAAHKVHKYSKLSIAKRFLVNVLPAFISYPIRKRMAKYEDTITWLDMGRMSVGSPVKLKLDEEYCSVEGLSRVQLLQTSLPMLLHWEDRDSMAHGIEARVPFLDYRLVETTTGLPDEYKLRHGVTKRVLRESMVGLLPEPVRMRMDKMGFVTPEEVWMRQQSPEQFRGALEEAVKVSNGLVNSNILNQFDEMVAGRLPFDFLYWRVISFGSWLKVFNVKV